MLQPFSLGLPISTAPRFVARLLQPLCLFPATILLHCRGAITEALGGELEFEFFHWWFNSIFLACACLTMLLFYGQYKQRVQDTDQLPIYYHTSKE